MHASNEDGNKDKVDGDDEVDCRNKRSFSGKNQSRFSAGGIVVLQVFNWIQGKWIQTADLSDFIISWMESQSLSISFDGNHLVAGDPARNAAVVLHCNNDRWNQIGVTLFGNQSGDGFGVSVGITDDGESVFVGASQSNCEGGAGYVSHLNLSTNKNWIVKSNFTNNNPGSFFGQTLSVVSDGSRLII